MGPRPAPATSPEAASPAAAATTTSSPRSQVDQGTGLQAPVEVDDERDDDPGFADGASVDSGSFVSSLNSSVLNYKYKNGRRYHAYREGAYLVPNDDDEQDRMDLTHHIYQLMLGGELHLAPIEKTPQRVLDLGTGTGIWAIDFADQYPSAEVIGTDLSPIQPKWIPPNCIFEVDDFEQDWTYKKQFDYIHGREMGGSFSDPGRVFRQAYDALSPGGYLEIQNVEALFCSDDGTYEELAKNAHFWGLKMVEGASKFGKPLNGASNWREMMEAAGFVDVQQEILKLPIGGWPKDPLLKEIGRYQLIQSQQAVDSYTPGVLSRVLGYTDEEVQVIIAKVKQDFKNPAIHMYLPVYFVWGRKPE